MSRWNDTITLYAKAPEQSESDGMWAPSDDEGTEVFCNTYTAGIREKSGEPYAGLRDYAEVQVRSEDYDDQTMALYKGHEYEITTVTQSGSFYRLYLEREVSNG